MSISKMLPLTLGALGFTLAGLTSCATMFGAPLSQDGTSIGGRGSTSAVHPIAFTGPPVSWNKTGALAYQPPLGAVAFPSQTLSPVQQRLLEGARFVEGKSSLSVRGKSFTYDCSGTILAIYYYAGINLAAQFNRYTGGGVTRIYKIMSANNLLYTSYYPQPGDIIFWDNTYDENGDGLWDDPLTHAGMVVGVSSNGEISYIHQNYAQGIVVEKMNLLYPNIYTRIIDGLTVTVNSPMRMKGSPPGPGWLSGQLFRALGKGYLLSG